jgi:NAD(P)-dependent dehydrogenase (short-subunit alcohol dehydrogenase family)
VAVLTGATRGLGRAIAVALARRGASLAIVGRSTEASPNRSLPGTLEHTAADLRALGVPVLEVAADLSVPDDVDRIVHTVLDELGRCDICIHNAAVSFLGPFLEVRACANRRGLSARRSGGRRSG